MPADFENVEEVGARLHQLENEAQGVDWAAADAVRMRGRTRAHRRAVAGTTVVCLGIATLGVSVTGNLPGQEGFLNTNVPIAGIPTDQRTVSASSGDGESSAGSTGTDGESDTDDPDAGGTNGGSPDDTDGSTDQSPGQSGSPTDTANSPTDDGTQTSGSPTPDPTETTPTMPPPSTSAVVTAAEFPTFSGVEGSWAESGSGTGEGRASDAWRCDKPALADLGAIGTAWRAHEWESTSSPGTESPDATSPLAAVSGGGAVGTFESPEEASDGYGDLVAAITDCSWGDAGSATSVSLSSGTGAWWEVTNESGSDDDPTTHVVGLVQRGSAVAYVALDQPSSDASASVDETLQAAADRLADWDG